MRLDPFCKDYEVMGGGILRERNRCIRQDRYTMNAMVLLPYSSFKLPGEFQLFYPSDLIPIALIRDPGFFPHVPIILFRFPALPVISLHVRVIPTRSCSSTGSEKTTDIPPDT